MSAFKTILVAVSDGEPCRSALDTALRVGRDFSGHVQALHVGADPTGVVPLIGEGMSSVMVEEIMAVAERASAERKTRARALFNQRLETYGIPFVETPLAPSGVCASWREEVGREDELIAWRGRLADLIVLGRPRNTAELPSLATLNVALMDSGRPVLVAPPEPPTVFGKRVVIAWNGSAEATRALAASMPFLQLADSITVLTYPENERDPTRAADLASYLAWHGIKVDAREFTVHPAAIGPTILEQVNMLGGDMLVMGAYTHSRLRQLILGGVTRHMLESAAIPLLLCH